MADLTADVAQGGVVALSSGFRLASLDGTPAADLAARLTVEPPLAFAVAADADGRAARITPSEPLVAGAVYRFTLTAADGRTLDSWAFQAHQPLRVVETLPGDKASDIPTNTGIEVTFDQDGVVDAAAHVTIAPRVDGRFEQHGRTLAFVPAEPLKPATIYTVTVTRGITVGGTGEVLESDVRFAFETARPGTAKAATTFGFTDDVFEFGDRGPSDDRALGVPGVGRTGEGTGAAEERARRGPSTPRPRRRHRRLPPAPVVSGLVAMGDRGGRADDGPAKGRRLRREAQ